MAILAECPVCHKKQSASNRLCDCGEDLVKTKKSKRVHYWINYRLPGGKQKRESVGFSIEEAKDAEGKRRSQKRENRIFDIKPDAKMSFNELTKWYLDLEKVKSRAYYPTLTINLNSFNDEFGDMVVDQIKPIDLENYQAKRKKADYADSYIDQAIGAAKAMVTKAFYNDLVGERTLKKFKMVEKLLKENANARNRILHPDEYNKLMAHLPAHAKPVITMAFHTGMRIGEILPLTWDKVDLKKRIISLEAKDTKDKEPRIIDIDNGLYEMLRDIPLAIHDNHVFLYKGKPMRRILRSLKTACTKAGIIYGRFEKGGFICHDLRHTFVTYARKAGVAQSVIMKTTGHSTTAMFHRYNTVDNEDTRNGINQFEDYVKSVDQNVDQKAKGANQ